MSVLAQGNMPILAHRQEILEAVAKNQVVVVVGETGCGKTTQIPQFLNNVGYGKERKIGVTQPRRLWATWLARYIASQVGCELGSKVGYKIRFDDSTQEGTAIKFMTDGILLREMQADPELLDYEVVVVDEAHERSMNIDFILGLLKKLIARVSDLKVVVTSATIDADKFSRFFSGAPIVNVSGRMYPVEVHYSPKNFLDPVQAVVDYIQMIHQGDRQGDILAFLAGVDQIKEACKQVEELNLPNLVVLPLYGEMSAEEQDKALASYTGQRKVVIATNIAETSGTFDDLVFLIDSGLIKQTEYNSATGIGILEVVEHSQAGCKQRLGRVGRTRPGVCYRLYTEENFNKRPKFTKPEIQRTDLAGVVLTMKAIGIKDVESFEFIDQPDPETFRKAHQTLRALGALDEADELTDIGWKMAELPLDPKIGRMIIAAESLGCIDDVIVVASGLSAPKSIFNRPKDKEADADYAHYEFRDIASDFLTLLKVWCAYEASNFDREWCSKNFLNWRTLEEMRDIQRQLRHILWQRGIKIERADAVNKDAISKAVASGLVENLLQYVGGHSYKRASDGASPIFIHPSSAAFRGWQEWAVCVSIIETQKQDSYLTRTYARQVGRIEPEWLPEIAPQLCSVKRGEPKYSHFNDEVKRSVETFFNGSQLFYISETVSGPEAARVFAKALIEEEFSGFDFRAHNRKVREQVEKLAAWSKDKVKPISDKDLEDFYASRLGNISSVAKLKEALNAGLDLTLKLEDRVTQEAINKAPPEEISIGNKKYPIKYGGKFPIVEIPTDEIRGIPGNFLYAGNQLLEVAMVSGLRVLSIGTNLRELKRKAEEHNRSPFQIIRQRRL